jgi:ATP-dependent exoDNAse (exonuclease V) beta subunit
MFAVYDPAKEEETVIKTFSQIADAHNMSDVLTDKRSIAASVKGLYDYLIEKYGAGKAYKEYPFMYKNDLGQIVGGEIDLLWETPEGLVIVDYKNYPGFDDVTDPDSKFYAGKYWPQLSAYREAASKMSGGKVLDTLVFYSVQGRLVRLK